MANTVGTSGRTKSEGGKACAGFVAAGRGVPGFGSSEAAIQRRGERGRERRVGSPARYNYLDFESTEVDGTMDGTSSGGIDEGSLTKGQLRKLRALRNSVGGEIGEKAFAEWLASQGAAERRVDGNAATIVDTLWPMVVQGTLSIPRGGYLIRRGRGRIIVEAARS